MPSKIQVDQIAGATGSTVTLPSGQTLDLSSGTVTLPSTALSALNASNLTSGTVPSARLSLTSSDLPTVPTTKGGTGLTSLGSADQVLKVNSGATGLEFGTLGSDFVLLSTSNPSSVSTVSIDGFFSSTYRTYRIYFDFAGTSGGAWVTLRVNVGGTAVTTSTYISSHVYWYVQSGGNNYGGNSSWLNTEAYMLNGISGAADKNTSGYLDIFNPLGTTTNKNMIFQSMEWDGSSTVKARSGAITWNNQPAISGVTIIAQSGNITGNFKLYGIK